jgi:FMN phosphatase YigB (HAD superfamily)
MIHKYILTDCDSVLLDWNKAFYDYMENELGYIKEPDTDGEYMIKRRYKDLTSKTANKLIIDFNKSDRLCMLEPYRDSVEWVKKLQHLGYEFIVISAFSEYADDHAKRLANLQDVFGTGITNLYGVGIGKTKRHILRNNWGDSDLFWIEDHFTHALAGYEEGLKPILIDHPTNKEYQTKLFPRVSNTTPWREIFDIVTGKAPYVSK